MKANPFDPDVPLTLDTLVAMAVDIAVEAVDDEEPIPAMYAKPLTEDTIDVFALATENDAQTMALCQQAIIEQQLEIAVYAGECHVARLPEDMPEAEAREWARKVYRREVMLKDAPGAREAVQIIGESLWGDRQDWEIAITRDGDGKKVYGAPERKPDHHYRRRLFLVQARRVGDVGR